MSKTYDVTLRIPVSKLATVIEVMDGEGELLSCNATVEDVKRKRKVSIVRHHANGTTGTEIAFELAKGGGEVTSQQVEKAFVEKGLAKVSAAPRLSELVNAGRLVLIRKGVYRIAPQKLK